jgi:hypothetical protein
MFSLMPLVQIQQRLSRPPRMPIQWSVFRRGFAMALPETVNGIRFVSPVSANETVAVASVATGIGSAAATGTEIEAVIMIMIGRVRESCRGYARESKFVLGTKFESTTARERLTRTVREPPKVNATVGESSPTAGENTAVI